MSPLVLRSPPPPPPTRESLVREAASHCQTHLPVHPPSPLLPPLAYLKLDKSALGYVFSTALTTGRRWTESRSRAKLRAPSTAVFKAQRFWREARAWESARSRNAWTLRDARVSHGCTGISLSARLFASPCTLEQAAVHPEGARLTFPQVMCVVQIRSAGTRPGMTNPISFILHRVS